MQSKSNLPFHNALRKDSNAFVWEILEEDDRDDRLAEELILGAYLGDKYCYNILPRACGFNSSFAKEVWQKRFGAMTKEELRQHFKSLAVKCNHPDKKAKRIKLTNIITKEEQIFDSSVDAAMALGLNARYLRKIASGERPPWRGYDVNFI